MFALREIPSDHSGFSAFELLYGRQVRGPLAILRDLWGDKILIDENHTLHQYVIELQTKFQECAKIAARNTEVSVQKYKTHFDLKSQDRQSSPGDKVLLLSPDTTNKLLVAWKGPFAVLERRNRVNYITDYDGIPKAPYTREIFSASRVRSEAPHEALRVYTHCFHHPVATSSTWVS